MTGGELNRLEREVEEARKRLTVDLDRLRAPEASSSFKNDLMSDVRNAKDQWIEKSTNAARDSARRWFEDIKNRAAANPAATVAIGAGVLWHLVRHPPITSLLVGAGVFGLMRTNPHRPPADVVLRAGEVARTVTEKAAEWSSDASEMAVQAGELAGSVKDKVGEWAAQSRDAMQDRVSKIVSNNEDLTGRATQVVSELIPDDKERDTLLLSAATLAIAAAVGIAYQRRAHG